MYAWGGDTGGWRGAGTYDFGSARARYDKTAASMPKARSYIKGKDPDMSLVDPRGKTISSNSENPIIIAVDVTGSMANWPGEIFDRLPLFYQTLGKYKEGIEVSFCAIGDATCDSYPLQVNDFSGEPLELEKKLKALGCEGHGGGQIRESYELFGYFISEHCKTPKAKSPFLLIYGDEAFYENVNPKQVKHWIGDDLQSEVSSKKVWQNLMQRFDLYLLHKPYGRGDESSVDKEVTRQWADVIGRQRIIELPSMERSVDVAMGLVAKSWGEYRDFGKSLNARHDDSKVKASVHHSLRFIDSDPSAKSVMSTSKKSKMTKSLTD